MISETNLQNLPRDKRIKRMFIPREGFVFVEADLSQAESRIVAWKAEERHLIEMYEKNEDVHSFVASMMFKKPVKKGMPERQAAKPIAHGSNYNMKPPTLAETVLKETGKFMTVREARTLQNMYYQNFLGIKSTFHRQIRLELHKNNRILTNPFGRRRKFWQPWGDQLFRQAYSHYAQSTVADIMNLALVQCWKHLVPKGVRIVAQVHDSILFEVPNALVTHEFRSGILCDIVNCMLIPFSIEDRQITIPVELKWGGRSWGDLEDIKHEEKKL